MERAIIFLTFLSLSSSAGLAVPGGRLGEERVVLLLDSHPFLVEQEQVQGGRGGRDEKVRLSYSLKSGNLDSEMFPNGN